MKHVILICLLVNFSVFLSACQNTNNARVDHIKNNKALYLDNVFPKYIDVPIESEQEIFAINDEMKLMVETRLKPEKDIRKRAVKLLEQIFSNDERSLDYEYGANFTAIDAYKNNQANCLSLTIMAYVLAKEAGLNVDFQDVNVPEFWVRNGQYNQLTGHVNLLIKKPPHPNEVVVWGNDLIQIDFDPYVTKKQFTRNIIGKNTVLAMYYNNKGAQALVNLEYATAYAYFKASTLIDPAFSVGWGNLGILYRLTNQHDLAIKTYRYALTLDDKNFTAMTNLAFILKLNGENEEVKQIEELLHRKRINNPYYHALLADEAFFDGNNNAAIKHYKKAIKLNKGIHEFYYELARVYYKNNELELAKATMKKAISINKGEAVERQYIAKLNFLKQMDASH